jgi:hypothetical protein
MKITTKLGFFAGFFVSENAKVFKLIGRIIRKSFSENGENAKRILPWSPNTPIDINLTYLSEFLKIPKNF